MKRTKLSWLYLALQIVFMLVVPCALLWAQWTKYDDLFKYKISVTFIIAVILIFWVFKRIFLDKLLKNLDIKIANIETNALTITEDVAIKTNKTTWRTYSIIQLVISLVIPGLVGILGILTIKVLQDGLIKLYGCAMFCAISIFVGVVFRVCEIWSIKLKHEKDKKDEK